MGTDRNYIKMALVSLSMVMLLPCFSYGADARSDHEISASGIVQKQGITTYMYGTHTINDTSTKKSYALRSSSVDLDKYVGRSVTVKGTLVPGYPVDFGPDYLEVKSVTDN